MSIHWKSRAAIGRFPLVHIAIGRNENGQKETAFGIVAVGQRAIGVVAIGQFGIGAITIAQFGFGVLVGLGQFILAPISVAQFTLAIIALAQFALGVFVIGQMSLGYMGVGQSGWRAVNYDWLQWFGMDTHTLATFLINHITTISFVIFGTIFALIALPLLLVELVRWIYEQIFDLRVRLGLVRIEEAEAEILQLYETGMYVNKVPIIEMLIEYVTRSGQRIKTKLRTPQNYHSLAHLETGSRISIVYDQAKPERPFLPRHDWKITDA